MLLTSALVAPLTQHVAGTDHVTTSRGVMSTSSTVKDRVEALVELYRDDVAPIVQLGDPVLRRKAEPFDGQFDDGLLKDFVELLRRTMLAAPGVGLAAPQVGVPLRIAVLEDPATVSAEVAEARERYPLEFLAVLNPEYAPRGRDKRGFYEGCLSMPGFTGVVSRPLKVDAGYSDLTGARRRLTLSGWQARIFQHETDHLNGRLYVDQVEPRSMATSTSYTNRWADPVPTRAAEELGFDLD
ncbi:Peptide deformylase [Kribbella flavida DSM 17836]|uniref:Peptide deformylase n=2 Tax=Kribbella flavida TaxID=182640 RepID=D2PP12_KRIFD|nr:Peptide deformylase [Kribbella flavida DSM 17836]